MRDIQQSEKDSGTETGTGGGEVVIYQPNMWGVRCTGTDGEVMGHVANVD